LSESGTIILVAAKEKLEIVNFCGKAARIFCPPDPSPPQAGEGRIPFELIQEYTATSGLVYFVHLIVSLFTKEKRETKIKWNDEFKRRDICHPSFCDCDDAKMRNYIKIT
jgi:hypothetical protein